MKPASRKQAGTDQRDRIENLVDSGPRGYRVGISYKGDSASSNAAMSRNDAEQFVDTFNELMDGTEFSAFWEPCLMLDSIQLGELFGREVAERFTRAERGD